MLIEGRGVNTPAETKTVNYIIDQFRSAGLEPGGDLVNGKRQLDAGRAAASVRSRQRPRQLTLDLGNGQTLRTDTGRANLGAVAA